METSQRMWGLINNWSKHSFTPPCYVDQSFTSHTDLSEVSISVFFSHLELQCSSSTLPYLCSGCSTPRLFSILLMGTAVSCKAVFSCSSMLFCFGGHRDLRTLSALLCAWPSLDEISHSLQKGAGLGITLMLALFQKLRTKCRVFNLVSDVVG